MKTARDILTTLLWMALCYAWGATIIYVGLRIIHP